MRRRILNFIFNLTSRHPIICLVIAGLITLISLGAMPNLEMETDLAGLLPSKNKEAQILNRTIHEFGPFDSTVGVISVKDKGNTDFLIEAASVIIPLFSNDNFFRSIEFRINDETKDFVESEAERRIVCLLTEDDRRKIEEQFSPEQIEKELRRVRSEMLLNPPRDIRDKIFEDPLRLGEIILQRLTYSRGPLPMNLKNGYFISNDGRMLFFFAKVKSSASNMAFNRELDSWKKSVTAKVYSDHPEWRNNVNFHVIGPQTEALYQSRLIRRDFFMTLATSFILVITLFIVIFRRLEALYLVALPLAVGIVWTLGLTALMYNRLTLVSFGFGAVLVGLGIDFAIHIYNRYLEEVDRCSDPDDAVKFALHGTGRGVFTGAVTTSLAFFGMIFTSFKGFQELGVLTGTGLLCCLVSIYLILPSILILQGRRGINRMANPHVGFWGLDRALTIVQRYPKLLIMIALVITGYMAWKVHDLSFDENLHNVKQRSPEYSSLLKEIGEQTALPSLKVVMVTSGPDLQAALENNDRLYANFERIKDKYPLLKYDSIRAILPAVSTQERSKAWVASLDIERVKNDIRKTADELKFNAEVFQPFFDRLDRLHANAIDESNLIKYRTFAYNKTFTRFVQMHVVRTRDETRIISYLFPLEGNWESYVPQEFLTDMSEGVTSVDFTGLAVIAGAVQSIVKRDLVYVTFIVFLAVALVLFLHFKSLLAVLLSILPLAGGMLWMMGLTSIFGVDLNFINVIVIPMIVGIGVDNGVHLLERWLNEKHNRMRYTIRYTGRALIITSLTTICGFGSLVLADFLAIREIGLLCLLGVISTLIVALFVLPSVLTLLESRIDKFKPTDDSLNEE